MAEKKLTIFLSYAFEQKTIAAAIESALSVSGHRVFFDKKSLPIGEEFHQKIFNEIKTSDLMIFLISPDSIQDGSYTRSELKFARKTGCLVFPVMTAPTDLSLIPNRIEATTILFPEGNIVAEVLAEINTRALKQKDQTISEHIEELKKQEIRRALREIDQEWEEIKKQYTLTLTLGPFDTGYVIPTGRFKELEEDYERRRELIQRGEIGDNYDSNKIFNL